MRAVLLLVLCACSAPPRTRAVDDATRDAAHRALVLELQIGQVLGYGWRYKR